MDNKVVPLGHVSGVHGVKGWVKIHSLTEPREAIFEYQPWLLGESLKEVRFSQGKKHGNRLIALFEDINDRESAVELVHQPIAVYRDQFPETESGEFYWTDLVGLKVELEEQLEQSPRHVQIVHAAVLLARVRCDTMPHACLLFACYT